MLELRCVELRPTSLVRQVMFENKSEGAGEEWLRGFGYIDFSRLLAVYNYPLSCTCGNPSRKRHMPIKESRFSVNNCTNRILITISLGCINLSTKIIISRISNRKHIRTTTSINC